MNLFEAIATAYRAGTEVAGAWSAAESRLREGRGPLAALRAFSIATGNRIDDEAVMVLEQAIATICRMLAASVDAAAWIAEHGDELRHGLEAVGQAADVALGVIIDAGYAASHYRDLLRAWATEGDVPG